MAKPKWLPLAAVGVGVVLVNIFVLDSFKSESAPSSPQYQAYAALGQQLETFSQKVDKAVKQADGTDAEIAAEFHRYEERARGYAGAVEQLQVPRSLLRDRRDLAQKLRQYANGLGVIAVAAEDHNGPGILIGIRQMDAAASAVAEVGPAFGEALAEATG